jgi:hypothetical protein
MTDNRTADELRAEAARLDALAADRDRQLGREDLATMTPEQIEAARARGQFADLLAGRTTEA